MTLRMNSNGFLSIKVIRNTVTCCTAALAIGLCSCSSTNKTVSSDPFLDNPEPTQTESIAATEPGKTTLISDATNDQQTVDPFIQSAKSPTTSAPTNNNGIRQVGFEQPAQEKQSASSPLIQDISDKTEIRTSIPQAKSISFNKNTQFPVTFSAAVPRVPANGDRQTSPESAPDEYLFDGGDRDNPIHYDDFNRLGLDTEDTVAEYTDHTGEPHVKASNRVAIYSPRFSSVRSSTTTELGFGVPKLATTADTVRSEGFENRTTPTFHQQQEGLEGLKMRSRASGFKSKNGQDSLLQSLDVEEHVKLQNAYQELSFSRTGQFLQREEATLAYSLQAASTWTRDLNPVIAAVTIGGQEVYASFKPQEMIGLDDRHLTKGDLRIVKLADKQSAKIGEIVKFTIRFDNLGDRELHGIRIVDNLTPRLVLIEESTTSDRDGRLSVVDNEEGSLVLSFELDEPLKGHTGGTITFEARVR